VFFPGLDPPHPRSQIQGHGVGSRPAWPSDTALSRGRLQRGAGTVLVRKATPRGQLPLVPLFV
jgi:hypothetical protein